MIALIEDVVKRNRFIGLKESQESLFFRELRASCRKELRAEAQKQPTSVLPYVQQRY